MIAEDFDMGTLANIEQALERASKQFPARLSDHEARKGLVCKLMEMAKHGRTALEPLTDAALAAASVLVDREIVSGRRDRSTSYRAQDWMPAAGPHARSELTDYDKTPGCGMLPSEEDTNPSPTS
jgi:hypothetical protein